MSIFILEDDPVQAQHMKHMAIDICKENNILYDFIEVTGKSANIIEKIPFTNYIPIYFLDIEIKSEERKGLQVAQEIRKYDTQGLIVFVTTHSEFSPISYQYMVSALTFIDKGLPFEERYSKFEQCLLQYQGRNQSNIPADDIVIENPHSTVRVPFKTIEYIMTDGPHRLALVTTNRLINFYGTLKEIELMDERLFRCHQSFIVSIPHISAYDPAQKMIMLKGGKRIPVSRRLVRRVRQLLKGEQ